MKRSQRRRGRRNSAEGSCYAETGTPGRRDKKILVKRFLEKAATEFLSKGMRVLERDR